MIDTNSERFREVNNFLTAVFSANLLRRGHLDDAERKALPEQVAQVTLELLTAWEASAPKADGATLAGLLASQEARDAAPCVAVTGPWHLTRGGALERRSFPSMTSWLATGHWEFDKSRNPFDCIWSGDLPALLAAMVAALEFYADEAAWNEAPMETHESVLGVAYKNKAAQIRTDRGTKARQALKEHPND
jgi:hypothetical protein